jgi:hypothetical protein
MKLTNYSKISNILWNAWRERKITSEEKDEMINHVIKVPILEDENSGLKIIAAGLLIVVLGLSISLIICAGA